MESTNASSFAYSDFPCCCEVSRDQFSSNGTAVVNLVNAIALVPISISAAFCNFVLLMALWRTPSLQHPPSNVLLVGLVVSDLGVGLTACPVYVVYNIAKYLGLQHTYCRATLATIYTGHLFSSASLFTMTAMSMDMFLSLHLHLRYSEVVTTKRLTWLVCSIWLFSTTGSAFYVPFWADLRIFTACVVPLCLAITTLMYYCLFRIVRRHQRQIHAQTTQVQEITSGDSNRINIAHQKKSLTTRFFVYCLFIICYLPCSVTALLLWTTPSSITKQTLYEVAIVLIHLNSSLNPFVYCWRSRAIRAAVIKTTRRAGAGKVHTTHSTR